MTINWKEDEIKSKISQLLVSISKVAMEDQVVTDDEQKMLVVIRKELMTFEDEFAQMVKDQLPLERATEQTKELFEKVISQAAEQAKKDGTITVDELVLIDRLAKFLRNEDISKYLE